MHFKQRYIFSLFLILHFTAQTIILKANYFTLKNYLDNLNKIRLNQQNSIFRIKCGKVRDTNDIFCSL